MQNGRAKYSREKYCVPLDLWSVENAQQNVWSVKVSQQNLWSVENAQQNVCNIALYYTFVKRIKQRKASTGMYKKTRGVLISTSCSKPEPRRFSYARLELYECK